MSDATTDFSPAPVAAPPVRLDDQGRLAEDVFCHNCDYNLRGLPRDGRCPECGEAIEPSLAPTCLRYSEPRWLRKLVAGAVLVLASAVVDTVLIVVRVYFLRFWSPAQFPLYCAQLAASLVAFLGFWKVTAPEPGDTETSGFTARYVLRMFAVLAVSLRLSTLILVVDVGAGPPAAAWAIGIVGVTVARFVAGCVFARQIALRVPNEPIARRFGTLIGVFLAFFAFYYAIVLSQMRSGTPMPSGPVPELASTPLFAYGAWLLVRLRSRVALVARRAAARVAGTEGRSDQASTPGN